MIIDYLFLIILFFLDYSGHLKLNVILIVAVYLCILFVRFLAGLFLFHIFICVPGISVGDTTKQLSPDDLMFSLSHYGMSNGMIFTFHLYHDNLFTF